MPAASFGPCLLLWLLPPGSNGAEKCFAVSSRSQERSTFSQESYVSSVRRRKLESQGRHPANSYAAFVLCPLILLGSHRGPSFRRRLPLCGTVLARQTWSF